MKSRNRIVIVGAGIVGSAVAYELARRGERDIVVLESEEKYDQHSTGRSAAYYIPMYESQAYAVLSKFSIGFLENPPDGFSPTPVFRRDGAVIAAGIGFGQGVVDEIATARQLNIPVELLTPQEIKSYVPVVQTERLESAAYYPDAGEIDVPVLVAAYRRAAASMGVTFKRGTTFTHAVVAHQRVVGAATNDGEIACEHIVNAAGAWVGAVAQTSHAKTMSPLVLRRHLLQCAMPDMPQDARWPFFRCPSMSLYFKLTDGMLTFSPMDASADVAGDCPISDDIVAKTIATINQMTTLHVTAESVRATAGHRVFGPDHAPLIGADTELEGFYWAGGMGGCGIMAAPAVGQLVSDAILGLPSPIDASASLLNRATLKDASTH